MPKTSPTHQVMLDARSHAREVLRDIAPHMIRGMAEAWDVRDRLDDIAKIHNALTALEAAMIADLNYNLEITGRISEREFADAMADCLSDLKGNAARAVIEMADERLIDAAKLFEEA